MQPSVFERGDTIQFDWSAPVVPDTVPRLSVIDSAGTILHSAYAIASGGGYFSLFVTSSPGWYVYEWRVLHNTVLGSVTPHVSRGMFRVDETKFTNP